MENNQEQSYLEKNKKRKKQNLKLLEIGSKLLAREEIKITNKTLERISDCAIWMEYLADKELENKRISAGVFCNNRFCPICSKNKSIRDTLAIKLMTDYIRQELKRKYILVTFTAPNVVGKELKEEITKYNNAFNRFVKLKKYKKVIKGYLRKLEVTYNEKEKTYHPHFHVLISVASSYFSHKDNYIKRDEWLADWQEVMNDKTITQVDVRRVKMASSDGIDKSILELTKYVAKDSNYLYSEEVFKYFYQGLKGKRIYAFGGDFKIARDKFKKGELDYLKSDEIPEWYWVLTNTWKNGNYEEKKEKLADKIFRKIYYDNLEKLEKENVLN